MYPGEVFLLDTIQNAKCYDNGDSIRLTFDWPPGFTQVFINDKLFTLQEYKKQGGFFCKKHFGENIFNIDGCTVTFIEKAIITCCITPKRGLGYSPKYSSYELTFDANYIVEKETVHYICGRMTYKLGEKITPGQLKKYIIRTEKDEEPNVFVEDTKKYEINILRG